MQPCSCVCACVCEGAYKHMRPRKCMCPPPHMRLRKCILNFCLRILWNIHICMLLCVNTYCVFARWCIFCVFGRCVCVCVCVCVSVCLDLCVCVYLFYKSETFPSLCNSSTASPSSSGPQFCEASGRGQGSRVWQWTTSAAPVQSPAPIAEDGR